MMHLSGLVRVVMGLLILLLTGGSLGADPGKPYQMTGKLKKIIKPKNYLLVSIRLDKGEEQDFAYDIVKKSEVVIDGKKGKLEDLKQGDQVRVFWHRIDTAELYEDGSIRGRVIDRIVKLPKPKKPR